MLRPLAIASCLLFASAALAEPTLVGFASLPPDTFRDGPTSGQFLSPEADLHGRTVPFENKQPVQGISSIVAGDRPGTFLALSDNGFGTKANSADYLLCVYTITPDWEAKTVDWELAFHLSDPDGHVPWPIVAEGETYPDSDIPVPAIIKDNRLLTGADFDPESMVRLPDGTFWLGDEFGPFLLHFDAQGRLLEPPVELPGEGMHSPDHPTKDPATAKIGRSRGFEGITLRRLLNRDGTFGRGFMIIATLEAPLDADAAAADPQATHQLVRQVGYGPTDARKVVDRLFMPFGSNVISISDDAEAIGEHHILQTGVGPGGIVAERGLLIERDNAEDTKARVKRVVFYQAIYQRAGTSITGQVADLLNLADPHDLDGDGNDRFRFPFLTIESVVPVVGIDDRTVLVANDNNYPLTSGRDEGEPDPTEFILIRFDKPLAELGAE